MIAPHAVPQNILDVEFKLFGSLTIKQFAYIAGAAFIGLIFYFIFNSLPWLMWPLILVCVALGIALALVKINQRPFDVWLTNYIVAVMTSQRSIYHKSKKTVSILSSLGDRLLENTENVAAKIEETKVSDISFAFHDDDKRNTLDLEESSKLGRLNDLFKEMSVTSSVNIVTNTIIPKEIKIEEKLATKETEIKDSKVKSVENDVIEKDSQEFYIKSDAKGVTPKRKILNEKDLEVIKSLRAHLAENLEKSLAEKRSKLGKFKKSKVKK